MEILRLDLTKEKQIMVEEREKEKDRGVLVFDVTNRFDRSFVKVQNK